MISYLDTGKYLSWPHTELFLFCEQENKSNNNFYRHYSSIRPYDFFDGISRSDFFVINRAIAERWTCCCVGNESPYEFQKMIEWFTEFDRKFNTQNSWKMSFNKNKSDYIIRFCSAQMSVIIPNEPESRVLVRFAFFKSKKHANNFCGMLKSLPQRIHVALGQKHIEPKEEFESLLSQCENVKNKHIDNGLRLITFSDTPHVDTIKSLAALSIGC